MKGANSGTIDVCDWLGDGEGVGGVVVIRLGVGDGLTAGRGETVGVRLRFGADNGRIKG